jgi:hypothetical protein
VIVIGTVELTVAPSLGSTERSTIVLKDVLHVPASLCATFSGRIWPRMANTRYPSVTSRTTKVESCTMEVRTSPISSRGTLCLRWKCSRQQDRRYTQRSSGPMSQSYAINCYWPDAEKQKWEEYKAQQAAEAELLCPDWVLDHKSTTPTCSKSPPKPSSFRRLMIKLALRSTKHGSRLTLHGRQRLALSTRTHPKSQS